MKRIINSLITAFSTWSKIPMPQIMWKEENMRYALCFLPLVGFAVGLVFLIGGSLCIKMGWSSVLKGALLAIIPILVTGGIHADGFCDVMDALSSWQGREKKLEILKDSRCGAFAVIGFVCLMLLYCGILSELNNKQMLLCALSFVISRSLGGIALLFYPPSRPDGMAALCRNAADKHNSAIVLTVILIISVLLCGCISIAGEIITLLIIAALMLWFRKMTDKAFGGITGDTIGFLIIICEIALAAGALFA